MNRQNHPDFESAYILADEILAERNGLDLKIWNTFINSRAGKPVMDKLAPEKKKRRSRKHIPIDWNEVRAYAYGTLGLKPWEYISLTEKDYYLLCIGRNQVEQKELSYLRKICWTMVCGYADPVKLPANERVWWPLGNDPVIKAPPRKKILKLHNKFMSLKFKKNG